MEPIKIGKLDAGELTLDPERLLDTRMLIQASSGGGKSYLVRVLAEQLVGQVQSIIIDPEGEFSTLRERHDLLLVGAEGEIKPHPKAAGLLARELCRLNVSAVLDLYNLELPQRRQFVRQFLEALMHVPREQWHPLVVVIDEAHVFAPEKSAGEAESAAAVITLMSQGGKRGFAGVLATQRLSKLHKDAAAEAKNVFIGTTTLDVDQRRAADTLGLNPTERVALRELEPGQFHVFGPALNRKGVNLVQVKAAQTTHPRGGHRHKIVAPQPSAAIRQIAAQLAALPEQAAAEARTLAEAQQRIRELERQLAAKPKPAAPQIAIDQTAIERAVREVESYWAKAYAAAEKQYQSVLIERENRLRKIASAVGELNGQSLKIELPPRPQAKALAIATLAGPQAATTRPPTTKPPALSNGASLSKGQRLILTALAERPEGRTKIEIAIKAGYAHDGGGFGNYFGPLRANGYISNEGKLYRITEAGLAALGAYEPLPAGADLLSFWCNKLGKAARESLTVLYHAHPEMMTAAEIAADTGYAADGGGFGNGLTELRSFALVEGEGRKKLKIHDIFFES